MKLNIQATTTEINNLIAIIQTAPSAKAYEKAIHALWAIFGDFFTALVAKKSYLLDSDFSLWGCSPAERRENLAGNAYMLFYKAVSDFEPSRKVPFAAYIAKIGEWRMLDEKRKNARRSKYEELDRRASNSGSDEEQFTALTQLYPLATALNQLLARIFATVTLFDGFVPIADLVKRLRDRLMQQGEKGLEIQLINLRILA